ncbi:MAG: nucleoside-diphosphate sugar epimerase/dehydratase, partial [Acidimicrobiales bacterium]
MPSDGPLGRRLLLLDLFAVAATWIAVESIVATSGGAYSRAGHAGMPVAATLLAMGALGLYRSQVCARQSSETARVAVACLFGAALDVAVSASGYGKALPGAALGGAACVVLVWVARWQFAWWLRACHAQGRFLRRVVLVGSASDAIDAWTTFSTEPELGNEVVGVVIDAWPARDLETPDGGDGVAVDVGVGRAIEIAGETSASAIIALPGMMSGTELRRLVRDATLAGLKVQLWPGLSGRLRCVPLAGESSFYVDPPRFRRTSLAVKRALDIVLATACLA